MGTQWGPSPQSSPSPLSAHVYCHQTVAHLSNCWALVLLTVESGNSSCCLTPINNNYHTSHPHVRKEWPCKRGKCDGKPENEREGAKNCLRCLFGTLHRYSNMECAYWICSNVRSETDSAVCCVTLVRMDTDWVRLKNGELNQVVLVLTLMTLLWHWPFVKCKCRMHHWEDRSMMLVSWHADNFLLFGPKCFLPCVALAIWLLHYLQYQQVAVCGQIFFTHDVVTSGKDYVIVVVCLFICSLRKNFRTDLHEIFREGWQWENEQMITFRWRSGSQIRIRIQVRIRIRIRIATLVRHALAEVCTVPVLFVCDCLTRLWLRSWR